MDTTTEAVEAVETEATADEVVEDKEASADTETSETEATQEETKTNEDETSRLEDLENSLTKWKKLSRSNESQKKELIAEKETWAKEKLSLEGQLHKAKTELANIQKTAFEAELTTLRATAAKEHRLPEGALKYLTGEDAESIAASAAELAETFGVKATSKPLVFSTQGTGAAKDDTPAHLAQLQAWAKNTRK